MRSARYVTCGMCGRWRPHNARGLCSTCRKRARAAGTLDDWPPLRRLSAEVAEDVEWLTGCPAEEITTRIGMTPSAIARALRRAGRPDLARAFDRLACAEQWARTKAAREAS